MNDTEIEFEADDGWQLRGLLHRPTDDAGRPVPGAVLVPGSHHERDAWTQTADALAARGVASLRIDVRGRGASLGEQPYARFTPGQRRRVARDVRAAVNALAACPDVTATRLAVVGELDTAAAAVDGVAGDDRVGAIVLLSARHGPRLATALAAGSVTVFGLVSSEDRAGLRATVDAYLAGSIDGSRLEVFDGLGFGITMASVRQFEHRDAEPLETMIADWLAHRLTA